jgi:hypothetical protein
VKDVTKKNFCLASTTQHDVPTNAEKQQLLVAGLGEKKVTLPGEGNANDVSVGLKETFLKLSDSGGYEFMHAKPVVTKTWTHNDPQRPTTTHYDPTTTPQRPPQRPTTIPKLPSVAILHDNKQYKLLFVDTPSILLLQSFRS